MAAVLRRLRRVAARYRSEPTFVFASATVADPEEHASRLLGMPVTPVTRDGSPRASMTFALWEPPLLVDETGQPPARQHHHRDGRAARRVRARARADGRLRAVARRVEVVARIAKERVSGRRRGPRGRLPRRLPAEERRELERVAALQGAARARGDERARAGRRRERPRRRAARRLAGHAVVALAAGGAGRPLRAARRLPCSSPPTTRSTRSSCTTPRRSSAAASRPPSSTPTTRTCSRRTSRRRPPSCRSPRPTSTSSARRRGRCSTRSSPAASSRSGRAAGSGAVRTGPPTTCRCAARASPCASSRPAPGASSAPSTTPRAHSQVHTGAVHLHQGQTWVITELDLDDHAAFAVRGDPGWTTQAQSVSDFQIVHEIEHEDVGSAALLLRTRDGAPPGRPRSCAACPAARCSASTPSTCRRARSRRRPCGGRCPSRTSRAPGWPRTAYPGPPTRPSTRRSACSRSSPPPTGGTSAACPPPCTRTRGCRRSSSTTGTPAGPASLSAATAGSAVAQGDPRSDRLVRVHDRLPLVHPVAEVRQRQRAARQGRGRRAARPDPAVRRARALTRRPLPQLRRPLSGPESETDPWLIDTRRPNFSNSYM